MCVHASLNATYVGAYLPGMLGTKLAENSFVRLHCISTLDISMYTDWALPCAKQSHLIAGAKEMRFKKSMPV